MCSQKGTSGNILIFDFGENLFRKNNIIVTQLKFVCFFFYIIVKLSSFVAFQWSSTSDNANYQ